MLLIWFVQKIVISKYHFRTFKAKFKPSGSNLIDGIPNFIETTGQGGSKASTSRPKFYFKTKCILDLILDQAQVLRKVERYDQP